MSKINSFAKSKMTKQNTYIKRKFQIRVATTGCALGWRHQLIQQTAKRYLVTLKQSKKKSSWEN